jgi:hypothetical protein
VTALAITREYFYLAAYKKEQKSLRKSDRDSAVVQRRLRLARRFGMIDANSDPGIVSGGRYRKGRPFGCPDGRCLMCHWHKVFDVKSHKERIADVRAAEQLTVCRGV